MASIERSYVIDLAVRDFLPAVDAYRTILGIEGVRMLREQDPSGELDAFHFPVGGLNALGIMTYTGEIGPDTENHMGVYLRDHGDGIHILGNLVDDVDQLVRELPERGFPVATPEPVPYADGRLIFAEPVHQTLFEFATHHSDAVTALWRGRAEQATERRIVRADRCDIAVRDLGAATKAFSNFLQIDPVDRADALGEGEGVVGVDFPVGGLRAYGLVSLEGESSGPYGRVIGSFLDRHGDGAVLMGFEVDDLGRRQRELEELGYRFEYDQPPSSAVGRSNLISAVYGVALEFTERA